MNVAGKVVAITGGGSGIGAALCARFAREGAAGVAVIDHDGENAQRIADEVGGTAFRCDVSDEAELNRVITETQARFGPIGLFCSNAGIVRSDPDVHDPASAPDEAWTRNWAVHVMAHVYAARRLGPEMAARGGGYFLNTISAAGLLTQVGSGTYSATKHASVGFAESLAIAYRDRNVRVSILCPQGVATPMVLGAMNTPAVADGIIPVEAVADAVIEGLADERFLILPHPQVLDYMRNKTANYDRWLGGMAKLARVSLGPAKSDPAEI